MLISETRFTDKNYLKINGYNFYYTQHPNGKAQGGTGIIIKTSIKHYELPSFQKDYLQATNVAIEDWHGPITTSAVYCPPRHSISKEDFDRFLEDLGNRFIAGGDYNAKHTQWGSRLITARGKNLLKCINANRLNYLSTNEPTHWPTDTNKLPDLLDFFITKNISPRYIQINSSVELSSDHSPVIATINSTIVENQPNGFIRNKFTNWQLFRKVFNHSTSASISLKTNEDIEAATEYLNTSIINAIRSSTPTKCFVNKREYPHYIIIKIAEKRRLRRVWQSHRTPEDKRKLNNATRKLTKILKNYRNDCFQKYIANLSPTADSNYSLWKASRKFTRPPQIIPPIRYPQGGWARPPIQKANLFASHLTNVFKPYSSTIAAEITEYLHSPFQMSPPIEPFSSLEVIELIRHLNPRKASGHDQISNKAIKELPIKGITLITSIFNAILRLEYYPKAWKISLITLIPKPGKPIHETSSYRPISLLPTLSKLFEKMLTKRLLPLLEDLKTIPDHQFGFRKQHSAIEQIHRLTHKISQDLEKKKYCSAVFLDIEQAFDKVWHEGLLFKLKKILTHTYYSILKSYLTNRLFMIKYLDAITATFPIEAGIPQGSVLGPLLFTIYTADLPTLTEITTATFADDTALLASHSDPIIASSTLQRGLDSMEKWFHKWRFKINQNKSSHITFTLRKQSCPQVTINNIPIPNKDTVRYLGMILDRRMTWKRHIVDKCKQLKIKLKKFYWLIGRRSNLNIQSKIMLYKAILKPVWTYGIQLWGTASNSNIEILQRFQSKTLRSLINAPWYVTNETIHRDLKIPTVKEEICKFRNRYNIRVNNHRNPLVTQLLDTTDQIRRLKRQYPLD